MEEMLRGVQVDDVLKMELLELMELCDKLDIASDSFVADSEFQSAILDKMKASRRFTTSFPPFATVASAFAQDVEAKRKKFVEAIDGVQKVLSSEKVRPWLQKLNVHKSPRWMEQGQLEETKHAVKGKPTLLIAGSTSAGKSTLANALLGEAMLPTSHNASTAVVCEIKYSSKPGKKWAVMHFKKGKETKTEEVNLMTSEGCSRYADCIVGSRLRTTSAPVMSSQYICERSEVYWPLEFLKDFTIVDSPGVTENEEGSIARQITEQFQRDLACGFMYVLDATRAAEEAAQVGGLVRTVVKATKSLPPPGSALFIVNKWDLLVQQVSAAEQKQFLRRIGQCLASRWPGFDASKQLLTMNAKLAAEVQELGSSTEDMRKLCDGIMTILPSGMDYMLLRGMSHPIELLDEIEQITDNAIRTLAMPAEDRTKKFDIDWQRLEAFKKSQENGLLAQLTMKLHDRIEMLVGNLCDHLKSEQGLKLVIQCKESEFSEMSKEWFVVSDVRGIVERGFAEAICQYEGYNKLCKWIQSEVSQEVHDLISQFMAVKGEMGASLVRQASCTSLAAQQKEDPELRKSILRRSLAIAFMMLPINWPGLLLSLGTAIFGKKDDDSSSRQRPDILSSNWLIRRLHKTVFWSAVEKAYQSVIEKACENKAEVLRQIIRNHLVNDMEVVQIVFRELPLGIQAVEQELIGRSKQKEADMGSFVVALEEIQRVKASLFHLFVVLKSPTFKNEEVQWLESTVAIGYGKYGPIYRATMATHGQIAIEEMASPVSEENTDELYYMISIAMQLSHKNLRKFYGSIAMSQEPLKLGLLLEWCGDMTLAALIFKDGQTACKWATKQKIALQLADALRYLHSMGIVHGALFPDCIMVTPELVIKLGCISSVRGIAHQAKNERSHVMHTAPEILLGHPFSISADIFSVGVLLWEVWHCTEANWMGNDMDKVELAKKVGIVLPLRESCAGNGETQEAPWVYVWESCWSAVPDNRPTASNVYRRLSKLRVETGYLLEI